MPVDGRAARADVAAAVNHAWAESLKLETVAPDLPWSEAGGDSLAALHLVMALERALGRPVSFDILDPEITPRALAGKLAGLTAVPTREAETIVDVFSGVYGDEPGLAELRRRLGAAFHAEAHPYPPLTDPRCQDRLSVICERFAAKILARNGQQGAVLIGWSFGGYVAHEVARQVISKGGQVTLVVALDTFAHEFPEYGKTFSPRVDQLAGPLRIAQKGMPPNNQKGLARLQTRLFEMALNRRRYRLCRQLFLLAKKRLSPEMFEFQRRTLVSLFRAGTGFDLVRQPVLPQAALYFSSEDTRQSDLAAWRELLPAMQVVNCPGGHAGFLNEQSLRLMVPQLQAAIGAARENSTGSAKPLDLRSVRRRALGLEPPPIVFAREYQTVSGSPDCALLFDGWYTPEASGVWAKPGTASLHWRYPSNPGTSRALLTLYLGINQTLSGRQTLHFLLNGVPVRSIEIDAATVSSLPVSLVSDVAPDAEHFLTIEAECPGKRDTETAGDGREFAFGIGLLRVDHAPSNNQSAEIEGD